MSKFTSRNLNIELFFDYPITNLESEILVRQKSLVYSIYNFK